MKKLWLFNQIILDVLPIMIQGKMFPTLFTRLKVLQTVKYVWEVFMHLCLQWNGCRKILILTILLREKANIHTVMINALDNNTSLEGINGLVYRKDGQVIENPDRPLIAPLSELPRASRDVIKKYHLRRALISTSRGCKRSCRFVVLLFTGEEGGKRQWRGLDMKDVAEEIQLIYNTYGISCFFYTRRKF